MAIIKIKKILAGTLISCVAFGAVGCAEQNTGLDNNTNVKTDNLENTKPNNNQENIESNKKPNDNIGNSGDAVEDKESIEDRNEGKENTTTDVDTSTNNIDNEEVVKSIEMLLYSKDVNTDEQVVLGKLELNEDMALEEKVEKLANELSEKVFDNLPIEFVKINDIEGKKVALFNLNEVGNNASEITFDKYEGTSWVNNYFAGSAGGGITEYTLITTLLQRNYTGEWIDGIEFTYKNSKVEFDHVPGISEISYR